MLVLQRQKLASETNSSNGQGPAGRPGHARVERAAVRRRVLVVEDNLDTLRSTTLLLRDMGHEVDFAINGYAAMEAARRFKPEIIVLDLGLPGMDGFELCRRLKADAALRAVRVIAVTGYGQEECRVRSREAGCEAHLVKPVDPKVLQGLIDGPSKH